MLILLSGDGNTNCRNIIYFMLIVVHGICNIFGHFSLYQRYFSIRRNSFGLFFKNFFKQLPTFHVLFKFAIYLSFKKWKTKENYRFNTFFFANILYYG